MKDKEELRQFLEGVKHPLVVVSTLLGRDREAVVEFLLKLNAPVYLEGISGLREEPRLQHLRISYIQDLWENAAKGNYPIDGILRIGGVPTFRPWRDLEDKQHQVRVCSLSHLPFSGLSWGNIIHVDLADFLPSFSLSKSLDLDRARFSHKISWEVGQEWMEYDRNCYRALLQLFQEEPLAEPSLFHFLSQEIPEDSMVYLGNSLPIREWDLAATYRTRGLNKIFANRGLNGIDGQTSTFLGLCHPHRQNWAILGDLTTLYDMAGPWILDQLDDVQVNIVIVNNGGGKIFSRMFPHKEFQNLHGMHFEPLAALWNIDYEKWESIPKLHTVEKNRMIELIPNMSSTDRFWKKYDRIPQEIQVSVELYTS